MKKIHIQICATMLMALLMLSEGNTQHLRKEMYREGWIDLNKNGQKDPYENQDLSIAKRVDDLLSRMTLEEKTCQMATLYGYKRVLGDSLPTPEWKNKVWKDGIGNIDEHLNVNAHKEETATEYSYPYSKHAQAINQNQAFFIEETRLGIPVDFTNEGIRGLCHDRATSFPAQIGVASTWNRQLVNTIGHITGREAKALGYTNIYSPILDLSRDPRWGRTVETYGENPFLVSELGINMVSGIQDEGVASTCKHFAVYSIPKGGRDAKARTNPHTYPQEVHEIYLTPFRKAITEAGALGVMSSYNTYNGVPITGSQQFLTGILNDWGFDGYIVSDSRAVHHLHSKHKVAETHEEAIRQAVEAGLNIRTDFNSPENYTTPLRQMVRNGKISMHTINERVRDVLRVKFKLGLFDQPYVPNPQYADTLVNNDHAQKTALQASRESIVLLKNQNNILPLNKEETQSLFITGPFSKRVKHSISRYGPANIDVTSVWEGINEFLKDDTEVTYSKGCPPFGNKWPNSAINGMDTISPEIRQMIDKATQKAANKDAAIVCLGETWNMVGESRSRTSLRLPLVQQQLLKSIHQTGTPVILVLINGRPLSINWADQHVPGILEAWFPGKYGGEAIADIIFGTYNPKGKLPVTFPKTTGQIPLNFPYKPGSHGGQDDWLKPPTRVTEPLYPFGYGLSYTSFSYSNIKVEPQKTHTQGNIAVTCQVKNTGDRAGTEIVQLYLKDQYSSVTTYVQKLRGFKNVSLQPGETKTVNFTLEPDELAFVNQDNEWIVEPGSFEVMIGSSSKDIRLSDHFELIK